MLRASASSLKIALFVGYVKYPQYRNGALLRDRRLLLSKTGDVRIFGEGDLWLGLETGSRFVSETAFSFSDKPISHKTPCSGRC